MSKGQVFIIIAILTVAALILIRTSLNLADVLESKRFLELGLERQEFQNVRNEFTKTIQISYNQTNIPSNVGDFFGFAKQSFLSRTSIFTGVGVIAESPIVLQSVNTRLNVTFMNYLDEDISSLNVTFNSNQQNFTSVPRSSSTVTNFTFSTASSQNYSLLVAYRASSLNSTENITIPVEIGTSKLTSFFDIRMSSIRLEQKDKFTQTIVLNNTRKV